MQGQKGSKFEIIKKGKEKAVWERGATSYENISPD